MNELDFIQRVRESEQMLYRISCTLLRSEEDRRDALQETALKAWQHRGRLREEKYFSTWITRILLNECRGLLRKNARLRSAEALRQQGAPDPDPELRMLLDALPENQRTPLALHYLEGFSLAEIARVQRVPLGTVKYRLHQARKALRVEMEEKEEKNR